MSRTKRYLEVSSLIKTLEKERESLRKEILGILADSPIIALDGCAVSKRVVPGYEAISAENLRTLKANPTLNALVQPFLSIIGEKQILEVKPLA